MFSVYVAASEELGRAWDQFLKERPAEAIVMGTTDALDRALSECARDLPGVLLLDDALLDRMPQAIELLQKAPYPVVLVAPPRDPGSTRRALAIKAKDLLTHDNWRLELLASLERAALPLYPRDRKVGRVTAVFSPKGGVGKTTLAVNLAVALADRQREPVAVVDLDLTFGDVSPMLALDPVLTIHDVVRHDCDPTILEQAMIAQSANVFVLAAPKTPDQAEDISGPALVKIVELLREDYAFVVMDLAPGYQETNVIALDLSDLVLTICTPDVVTLRTVGQALSLFRDDFRYPPEKIRLVLNRTGSRTGIERSDISTILKTPQLYELPSAGSLPVRAANQGVPFITQEPSAPLAKAIRGLADELTDGPHGQRSSRQTRRQSRPRRP